MGTQIPDFPEVKPVGYRRLLNRLAARLRSDDGVADLLRHNVRVDGHWITEVSHEVARDLLNSPFAPPAEQAAALQRIVKHARRVGDGYEVPIVRTRLLGPTTVAALRIAEHSDERWVAYWWFED